MNVMKQNRQKLNPYQMYFKLNLRDKIYFIFDLVRAFIIHGRKGVKSEILEWEESIEIMDNPEYDKRIREVQDRMAHSV